MAKKKAKKTKTKKKVSKKRAVAAEPSEADLDEVYDKAAKDSAAQSARRGRFHRLSADKKRDKWVLRFLPYKSADGSTHCFTHQFLHWQIAEHSDDEEMSGRPVMCAGDEKVSGQSKCPIGRAIEDASGKQQRDMSVSHTVLANAVYRKSPIHGGKDTYIPVELPAGAYNDIADMLPGGPSALKGSPLSLTKGYDFKIMRNERKGRISYSAEVVTPSKPVGKVKYDLFDFHQYVKDNTLSVKELQEIADTLEIKKKKGSSKRKRR